MDKPTELVIIGGGSSIAEGIEQGLKSKLKGKFVLGCNYAFRYFSDLTATVYVDKDFYIDEYDNLAKLPLVIGQTHQIPRGCLPNTIMLPGSVQYTRDLSKGVYIETLCGLFGLSLGIHLLDVGTIWILGHDFGPLGAEVNGKAHTHFYQGELQHGGIGKIGWYQSRHRIAKAFAPYVGETRVKIYNISPNSRIPQFEKLTYEEFFKKLSGDAYDQGELRSKIISDLKLLGK